jgi:hypothetical protein
MECASKSAEEHWAPGQLEETLRSGHWNIDKVQRAVAFSQEHLHNVKGGERFTEQVISQI